MTITISYQILSLLTFIVGQKLVIVCGAVTITLLVTTIRQQQIQHALLGTAQLGPRPIAWCCHVKFNLT